jgi:hypothetical protein
MHQELRNALKFASPIPGRDAYANADTFSRYVNDWNDAAQKVLQAGYGDDPEKMCGSVFWVPGEAEFIYGFVFKETNNGTTYVVSPVPLPYLEVLT